MLQRRERRIQILEKLVPILELSQRHSTLHADATNRERATRLRNAIGIQWPIFDAQEARALSSGRDGDERRQRRRIPSFRFLGDNGPVAGVLKRSEGAIARVDVLAA